MPELPDRSAADPLPDLPCWQALVLGSQFPTARQNKASADPWQVPRLAIKFIVFATVVLLSVLFLIYTLRALHLGYWQLPTSLLFAHLPYVVLLTFIVKKRRELYRETPKNSSPPKPNLLSTTLGAYAVQPAFVGQDGLHLTSGEHLAWSRFTQVRFLGEAEKYFAVQLDKDLTQLQPSPAWAHATSMAREVEEMAKTRRQTPWQRAKRALVLYTPPVSTVCLTVSAFHQVGWRADVIAAAYLVAGYVLMLLGSIYLRTIFWTETMAKADTIREQPTLELLFDSREVTAQNAMQRLQHHIGGDMR